jgi:hypothetical protein
VVAFPKLPDFQQVTLKVLCWEARDKPPGQVGFGLKAKYSLRNINRHAEQIKRRTMRARIISDALADSPKR